MSREASLSLTAGVNLPDAILRGKDSLLRRGETEPKVSSHQITHQPSGAEGSLLSRSRPSRDGPYLPEAGLTGLIPQPGWELVR